jgi:hypothetical protein
MIDVRIFGLAMTILLLATIVRMVRRRRLRAKYSFLWLMVGSVVLVLAAIPGLSTWMSNAVGIYYPPAFLFLCAIMLLIFVVVHFSWELSRLEDRGRIVAEELAIATERIDRLERRSGPSVAPERPVRQLAGMDSR